MTDRAHHGPGSAPHDFGAAAGPRGDMTDGAGGRRTQDPSGWLIVRRDGNVVTAERRACELLGAPDPDALAGREWASLLAQPDNADADAAREAITSGSTWEGSLRFRYARDEVTLGASVAPVARSSELTVVSLQPITAAPSHTRGAAPVTPPPRPRPPEPRQTARALADAPSTAETSPDDLRALVSAYEAMQDLDDPMAVARSVLQAIESAIGFHWAAVIRFISAPGGTAAEVLATYPTPMAGVSRGRRWTPVEADLALVRSSGEPSLLGELVAGSGESPLDRLPAFGLRSRVLVPLYTGADVIGALALFRTGPLAFTAAEALATERTVRRLGEAIARERDVPQEQPQHHEAETPMPPQPQTLKALDAAATTGAPRPTPASEASSLAGNRQESLGELVAGVAHELNNPLTAILGYSQILSGLEGTEREHALRTIEDEARRAARIVRNLLSFARQRPGQRHLVNVEEMLRRVIDLRRYALEMDDVHVVTRLGLVPEVLIDEGQFEQVFLNLLNNAQQALQGRGGEVIISTWQESGSIYVAFADDGPGVPDELRSRIFEPFFTTREVGLGQGMGLAIVYGVVSHHGGRTWVEENASGGATFVVELPLPRNDSEATVASGAAATNPSEAAPQAARRRDDNDRKRILVVDDEGAVRALTREILSAAGYAVETAESGDEALDLLEDETFDLVITDLRMPGMDGATLFAEIQRRWPELQHRVLFVTGDIEGEPNSRTLDADTIHYLEKPFNTHQLLNVVRDLVATETAPQA